MPIKNGNKSAATPKGKGGRAAQTQPTLSKSARRRLKNRLKTQMGVPQARPLQSGVGQTRRVQETIRVPISCRMTPVKAENDQAFVLNPTPTELVRETQGIETATGLPQAIIDTPYAQSEYSGLDEWTKAQGNLYSKCRLYSGRLRWVPRTGLTAKGEIVLGQLSDATDVLPARESGATVNTSRLTSQWDGRPADIEALSGSTSGPVRDPLTFPLQSSGEWSKVDAKRAFDHLKARPTGIGPYSADWAKTVEEGVLHYLKDGLVLGHVQGLGDTGGGTLTNLDEAGHFRFEGLMEFSGRNTTAEVHAVNTVDPPSRSLGTAAPLAEGPGGVKVEPVVLGTEFTHTLTLDERKVKRGGPDALTSPFGGVSVAEPDPVQQARPYWRHAVQYDPDLAGFDKALLRVEGGELLEGDVKALRLTRVDPPSGTSDRIGRSYLVESLSRDSRIVVVSKSGQVSLFSRPVQLAENH